MKIFVFDTETTWFINKKEINNLDAQPKIIQFAGILWELENWKFIEEKIEEILSYINESDVIIWHNIEYDEDMIKIELRRLDMLYRYQPKQVICTMKTTVDFCAIKWNWERFKYPKLGELHKKLFDEYFIWAHDALTDVEATLRCFVDLVNKWVLKVEEKQQTMTLF